MTRWDTHDLGERVRRLRTARGVTLKQVEAAVGISATHVSEIERGKTSPTIGALAKIANALKVDMAFLLEVPPGDRIHVSRPDERRALTMGAGALELVPLSNPEPGIELSVFDIRMSEHAVVDPRPSRRWGEDILVGVEGDIDLALDGRTTRVRAGETVHVRGEGALRFTNPGQTPVRAMWATFPKYVL